MVGPWVAKGEGQAIPGARGRIGWWTGSVTRPARNTGAPSAERGSGANARATKVGTWLLRTTVASNAINMAASTTAEGMSMVVVDSEGISSATTLPMASANQRRGVTTPIIRLTREMVRPSEDLRA